MQDLFKSFFKSILGALQTPSSTPRPLYTSTPRPLQDHFKSTRRSTKEATALHEEHVHGTQAEGAICNTK